MRNSMNQKNSFSSAGRGFQAQQSRTQPQIHSDAQQHRPPPPGERRMTTTERDLYRDAICQYCDKPGHVAKIYWWLPKKIK